MGIAKHLVPSNDTEHKQTLKAETSIPEDAIGVKPCGCYTIRRVEDRDRVWVTYTDTYIN